MCLQLLPILCCALQLPAVSHLVPSLASGTSTYYIELCPHSTRCEQVVRRGCRAAGEWCVRVGVEGGAGKGGGKLLVGGPCGIHLTGTTG